MNTDLRELFQLRRNKIDELHNKGIAVFPHSFIRSHTITELRNNFDILESQKSLISTAGRIISKRDKGKTSFAHVTDENGKIQIYVRKDELGEKAFDMYKILDLGDIIGIQGTMFKTHTGEISILVSELTVLAKSLRPLPVVKEKIVDGKKIVYDEFSDKESRYRQRYVDLNVNPAVRDVFKKRSRILSCIRHFLNERGFLEVETPALQPLYGGAAARPFETYHNTLDMQLFLRISDELYLKRLIVGGFEKVFEIGKDFRNEGMDRTHNPEFTMLELYQAYADYNDMMNLMEELMVTLAHEICGGTTITYQDKEIDLKAPWKRIPFYAIIKEYTDLDLTDKNKEDLQKICKDLAIEVDEDLDKGALLDEIFSDKVEKHLIQPLFVTDYPVETTPLAKRHRGNSALVERFEPFINGQEIGNAFSELNDPIDQRQRFEMMSGGKPGEKTVIDEDYLRAMEYGMPPTGGLGIGIDRIVMLLTNSYSIRDVILFPQMRPEE